VENDEISILKKGLCDLYLQKEKIKADIKKGEKILEYLKRYPNNDRPGI